MRVLGVARVALHGRQRGKSGWQGAWNDREKKPPTRLTWAGFIQPQGERIDVAITDGGRVRGFGFRSAATNCGSAERDSCEHTRTGKYISSSPSAN